MSMMSESEVKHDVHLHFSELLFELVFLYFQQYYLLLLCNTQYKECSEKVWQ